jgi:hypothetical protein
MYFVLLLEHSAGHKHERPLRLTAHATVSSESTTAVLLLTQSCAAVGAHVAHVQDTDLTK